MYRTLALAAAGAFALGCGGPLTRPLPERLDAQSQKDVDHHWNKALTPVTKHDRATWLDVMVGTRAYENGIDKFSFKSEKTWSGGTVVMEANFDRAKPADDRFTVTVFDKNGKELRKEIYTRDEVEVAYRELFPAESPKGPNPNPAATDARWKRVQAVLPQPPEAQE